MQQPWPDLAFREDLAACRLMLSEGSRTFHAASLLLPRRVRDPATAFYAFCRAADDAIDLGDGKAAALARLRSGLDAIYAGRPPPTPADRALAGVVARHAIPRALLDGLLEGFAWDAEGRRYDDLAGLHAYAARVAGTVGAVMALLMGARSPAAVARACDLGVAMQLTNIARDVGEDARAGRLYLPRDWMREAGLDPDAWLARPRHDPALASVVHRLLRAADALYARADAGIALLPLACRPGIGAARRFYAEIGREVERAGCDSVTRRAAVPFPRKAGLLVLSLAAAPRGGAPRGGAPREGASWTPPLDATRFLVEAVGAAPALLRPPRRPTLAEAFDRRCAWLFDLFVRLEQHQASGRGRT